MLTRSQTLEVEKLACRIDIDQHHVDLVIVSVVDMSPREGLEVVICQEAICHDGLC